MQTEWERERERWGDEAMCWWWWCHSKRRELPLHCVPGPQPLAAHYQFWLSHLKGLLIFIIIHHFLSSFFFLINMATLEKPSCRGTSDFTVFDLEDSSGPKLSAVAHLCHNVGICHIKMICVEFAEIWTTRDNHFTRNKTWVSDWAYISAI